MLTLNVSSHSIRDFLEAGLMRGIVDQNIETAKFGDGAFDDLSAVSRILDISRHQHSLSSSFLNQAFCLNCVIILA
jgi:hypothetical protein